MKEIQKASSAFTREQVDLIKQTVARGASDAELSLFLYTAQRTGLDPLTKQIHAIKRWDSAAGRETMAIQTGIDGYRLIADRTGQLAGISDVEYDREDKEHPDKATVTVFKLIGGEKCPFTASARWNEYCAFRKDGKPMALWAKMPFLMLGKCAEALALRKAFPANLSGIYTFEEMSQTENGGVPIEVARPVISAGSGAAVASAESHPGTQPEDRPTQPATSVKPTPKAATRKPSPIKPLKSNYDRLLEFVARGGYSAADFMACALKNKWLPDRFETLEEVPDVDLGVFLDPQSRQIIQDQLESMPKDTINL